MFLWEYDSNIFMILKYCTCLNIVVTIDSGHAFFSAKSAQFPLTFMGWN